jgi:hypothetical protein
LSTSGYDAATPAFVTAPFVIAPFNFLVTLDPIPDPNVGGASNEQELPILVKVIFTFYGFVTIITQGHETSKVMASKQIIGTANHILHPKRLASKHSFA